MFVRRPVGPVRWINIRSGVEWPFPSREGPLLAARGGRWLLIAVRRELPISAVSCGRGRGLLWRG